MSVNGYRIKLKKQFLWRYCQWHQTDHTAYPLLVGFDRAWDEIRKATDTIRQSGKCSKCEKSEIYGICTAVCQTETGDWESSDEPVLKEFGTENPYAKYLCIHDNKTIYINW